MMIELEPEEAEYRYTPPSLLLRAVAEIANRVLVPVVDMDTALPIVPDDTFTARNCRLEYEPVVLSAYK